MKRILIILYLAFGILSCEEILLEEDLTEENVILIAPAEGSKVENTIVNFSWQSLDIDTDYRLQIATPSFENANQIVLDTLISDRSFTTELVKRAYEWRVRAQNTGSFSQYTAANFAVVEPVDFSARTVVVISPEENDILNTTTINMEWNSVEDAETYHIQLLDQDEEVVSEERTTGTNLEITVPEGDFFLQIRAENSTQNTLYTRQNLTIDTTNPQKPEATLPENESTLTETLVSFEWTRENIAGSAEFDSIYVYANETLTDLVIKDRVTSPETLTLDTGNTYYWFIKAFDEAGNQSENGDVNSFDIN